MVCASVDACFDMTCDSVFSSSDFAFNFVFHFSKCASQTFVSFLESDGHGNDKKCKENNNFNKGHILIAKRYVKTIYYLHLKVLNYRFFFAKNGQPLSL